MHIFKQHKQYASEKHSWYASEKHRLVCAAGKAQVQVHFCWSVDYTLQIVRFRKSAFLRFCFFSGLGSGRALTGLRAPSGCPGHWALWRPHSHPAPCGAPIAACCCGGAVRCVVCLVMWLSSWRAIWMISEGKPPGTGRGGVGKHSPVRQVAAIEARRRGEGRGGGGCTSN